MYECFSLMLQNEGPDEGAEASSLQGRLPALTRKMKKKCVQLLKKNPVPDLAEDLDCFTGNKPTCAYCCRRFCAYLIMTLYHQFGRFHTAVKIQSAFSHLSVLM